ncbi:glycogen debranching N-terminal domain-containing protein [Streptomyces sp. M19]
MISDEGGQLSGHGLDGFYRSGHRVLARCRLRVAGQEPVPVQGRMLAADRARFMATVAPPADAGPDPVLSVERLRHADGTERITLRSSSARTLRMTVEVELGTDLAELSAVAQGRKGRICPAVSTTRASAGRNPGLRRRRGGPRPEDTLAAAGLLRWEVELASGAAHSIQLRVRLDRSASSRSPGAARPRRPGRHRWRWPAGLGAPGRQPGTGLARGTRRR